MDKTLADQIVALPALNKTQLVAIWAENFSKAPPSKLRKELMVPILAYRMQEKEYGGWSHSAHKQLREIAKSIASEKRPQQEIPSGSEKGTVLHLPPVISPLTAVQAVMAQELRKRDRNKEN